MFLRPSANLTSFGRALIRSLLRELAQQGRVCSKDWQHVMEIVTVGLLQVILL